MGCRSGCGLVAGLAAVGEYTLARMESAGGYGLHDQGAQVRSVSSQSVAYNG